MMRMAQRTMKYSKKESILKASVICLAMIHVHSAVGQTTSSTQNTLMGIYVQSDGGTSAMSCGPGETFSTSKTYAACCPTADSNCDFYTNCVSGTAFWRYNGASGICPTDFSTCLTLTIIETFPSANNSWSQLFCVNSLWVAHTIYREIPVSTSSSSLTTQTATPASSVSASGASNTAAETTSTGVGDPANSPSKAWIAGAVAGPVIALLALGTLAFWCRRKKIKQRSLTPSMAQSGSGYIPELVSNAYPSTQGYTTSTAPHYPSNSPHHHYSASGTPHPMAGHRELPRPVSELDSGGMQHKPAIVEAP